jgi:molybdopterin converting factor subunit 1
MASYVGSFHNDSPTAEFELMTVSVMLFARAKDLAGTDRIELELETDGTILDLKRALSIRCPLMSAISDSLLWAVNNQYANDTTTVRPADTVACFPPVSGG